MVVPVGDLYLLGCSPQIGIHGNESTTCKEVMAQYTCHGTLTVSGPLSLRATSAGSDLTIQESALWTMESWTSCSTG